MSIFDHFKHITLSNDQSNALEMIQNFLSGDLQVFILKGYAGSGKTTLLKGIVDYLKATEINYQLMAPTGRAAKVISQKTGFEATTIHKGIYSFDELKESEIYENEESEVSFKYFYSIRKNSFINNPILIIDEASMVSDIESQAEFFGFGSGFLLKDLLEYAKINLPDSNSKLLFIGDPAQLPPIGMNFSPALDSKYLTEKYNLKTIETEIREVKRQTTDSGILKSATKIRQSLSAGFFNHFNLSDYSQDINNINFEQFLDSYISKNEQKIVITYKNETANDLNQLIRKRKYGAVVIVQKGDIMLINANNYQLGVFNGEFGVISNVDENTVQREVRYYKKNKDLVKIELIWRNVELFIPDENGNTKTIKAYMLENLLNESENKLYDLHLALFIDFKNRFPRKNSHEYKNELKKDPFLNCLSLKYGYAVTCHKAQGGEWDTSYIFWDKGTDTNFDFYHSAHSNARKTNAEFYRWAYTAITRATNKIYCINPPKFTSFSTISFIDIELQDSIKQISGKDLSIKEITLDEQNLQLLKTYGLENMPIVLQNHFLQMYFITKDNGIETIKWEKINHEIRYYFKKDNEKVALKFWINANLQFNANFQQIAKETNSLSLFNHITGLNKEAHTLIIKRNDHKIDIPEIELDEKMNENAPYLGSLFDSMKLQLVNTGISVFTIEHFNFKERYTFIRDNEKAVIDFTYNNAGFFGYTTPVGKLCNSQNLLSDIKQFISKLKE